MLIAKRMEFFDEDEETLYIITENRPRGTVYYLKISGKTYIFVSTKYSRVNDLIILPRCKYIQLPNQYYSQSIQIFPPRPILRRTYRGRSIELSNFFLPADGVEWFLQWTRGEKVFFSSEMESYVKESSIVKNKISESRFIIYINLRFKIRDTYCLRYIVSFLDLYEPFQDIFKLLQKEYLKNKYSTLNDEQIEQFVVENNPIIGHNFDLDDDDEVGNYVVDDDLGDDDYDSF